MTTETAPIQFQKVETNETAQQYKSGAGRNISYTKSARGRRRVHWQATCPTCGAVERGWDSKKADALKAIRFHMNSLAAWDSEHRAIDERGRYTS